MLIMMIGISSKNDNNCLRIHVLEININEKALNNAIPKFLRFNIFEGDVRNVV